MHHSYLSLCLLLYALYLVRYGRSKGGGDRQSHQFDTAFKLRAIELVGEAEGVVLLVLPHSLLLLNCETVIRLGM